MVQARPAMQRLRERNTLNLRTARTIPDRAPRRAPIRGLLDDRAKRRRDASDSEAGSLSHEDQVVPENPLGVHDREMQPAVNAPAQSPGPRRGGTVAGSEERVMSATGQQLPERDARRR